MTDRELMQQCYAVPLHEQLTSVPENSRLVIDDPDGKGTLFIPVGRMCHEAAAALRERLAQPEQDGTCSHCAGAGCVACDARHLPEQEQETVMAEYKFQTYAAYKTPDGEMKIGVVPDDAPLTLNGVPLYPRREWVGLTDEDIFQMGLSNYIQVIREAEAKLKEKNT